MSAAVPSLTVATVAGLSFHNRIARKAATAGAAPSCTAISVMNFNLLARCFTPAETAALMTFEQRVELNAQHIACVKPMLLVTEETDECYFDVLAAHGYAKAHAYKKGDSGEYTGVFFRQGSGLKRIASDVVRVDGSGKRTQFAIVMIVSFEQQMLGGFAPPYEFALIAQHAKAGRSDEMEDARIHDASHITTNLLPEFLRAHNASHLLDRVLWVGDFNAGPTSYGGAYPCRLMPWLLTGAADHVDASTNKFAEAQAVAPCPLRLVSAHFALSGAHPAFTTCKTREHHMIVQCIDYIVMSPTLGEVTGMLVEPAANPATELAPTFLPLPHKWGSDHVSVYVEIDIAKARAAAYAAEAAKKSAAATAA